MKKIIILLTVALASVASAQTSNLLSYVNTGSGANTGTGDPLRTAFGKINGNFALLSSIVDSNAASGGGSLTDVTNVATAITVVSSNGVVGWVNTQNFITALTTNIARTSHKFTLFTTNNFTMSGSNYVGRFSQVYDSQIVAPQVPGDIPGLMVPVPEKLWGSFSGTNNWFPLTNGAV